VAAVAGLTLSVKPVRRLHVTTRRRGLALAGAGLLVAAFGLTLPAPESRAARIESRLDEFVPGVAVP
jgi:hypothetical protein